MEHKLIQSDENHVPHRWKFQNESERLSATIDGVENLDKLALQVSDNTYWRLTSVSPVQWAMMSGSNTVSLVHPVLIKQDYASPCFIKTTSTALSIKAGTAVYVAGGYKHFDVDTMVSLPVLAAGKDYSVWVLPNGTVAGVADAFESPALPPVAGAIKIGGFHYGLVEPDSTVVSGDFNEGAVADNGGSMRWRQEDVDKISGINAFSLWDSCWHCATEQYGMTYDPYSKLWVAIYFAGPNHHMNGISAYNTPVSSSSVLPKIPVAFGGDGIREYGRFSYFEANEIAFSHGLRLPDFAEFSSFAFGVDEAKSIGGASETIPLTGRSPKFTSRIGVEQATGHQMIYGRSVIGYTDEPASLVYTGRGYAIGQSIIQLFGGNRNDGTSAGSRAVRLAAGITNSWWTFSLRAVGEHIITRY